MDLEFTEGMQFDKGYLSPYFVTDQERMEAVSTIRTSLSPTRRSATSRTCCRFLNQVMQSNRPLLILSEDVEGEALATLIVNKLRGTFNAAAVKAPGFGDRRKRMLEDIAILTGGEVITEELGLKLENTQLNQLGRPAKVVITKDDTTVVDGAGETERITGRINQIRSEIETTDSDFDHEKLQERPRQAGRRRGRHQGRRRYRDGAQGEEAPRRGRALRDQRGPGRGHRARRWRGLPARAAARGRPGRLPDGDERTGARIIHRGLEEPIRQIAINAGAGRLHRGGQGPHRERARTASTPSEGV